MPVLRPLRALHYGPDHWEILDELVSPATRGEPEDRRRVGEVHPLCIRQLIRGERGELAKGDEPVFTHAARLLSRWKEQGVLVRDSRPSFYPIQQTSGPLSRRGLVCLVRLSAPEEGIILAHEETAGDSSLVLTQQLEMTRTQLSLILGVLPDESGALAEFLTAERGPPALSVTDGRGLTSHLWREPDPAVQLPLLEALRDEVAVLADGHHRYAAALAHQASRAVGGNPATREHPSDYAMMLLVPASDPGLRCAPTHRVCPVLGPQARSVLDTLSGCFDSIPLDGPEALEAFLRADDGHRFGQVFDGAITGMRLKDGIETDLPFPVSTVDTAVLGRLVVDPLEEAIAEGWTGITTSGHSGSPFSHNQRSADEILAEALRGEIELALFVQPPTAEQVLAVARAGQTLPSKSTNFSPKPTKGLLMSSLVSF